MSVRELSQANLQLSGMQAMGNPVRMSVRELYLADRHLSVCRRRKILFACLFVNCPWRIDTSRACRRRTILFTCLFVNCTLQIDTSQVCRRRKILFACLFVNCPWRMDTSQVCRFRTILFTYLFVNCTWQIDTSRYAGEGKSCSHVCS